MRPLSEIVEEGERLRADVQAAIDMRMPTLADEAIRRANEFSIEHFARLLAVAEAAMEAERLLCHALDESSGAVDSYEALWIMQSAARDAVAAFDSALARLAQGGKK